VSEPTYEEALAHFGVKGMRWGVRNPDVPHGNPGAYKSVKAKRSDFTRQQRKAFNNTMRFGNQNRTYKQIRRGEKAAAAMLTQFGGLQLGTAWISPNSGVLTDAIPRVAKANQGPIYRD